MAFHKERLGVDCRVFLPKPLEYCTGKNIHFFVDFVPSSKLSYPSSSSSSSSSQSSSPSSSRPQSPTSPIALAEAALNLLHHRQSTRITLQRRMDFSDLYRTANPPDVTIAEARTWRFRDPIDTGHDEDGGRYGMMMQGEMFVPPGALTTFRFPYIQAQVSCALSCLLWKTEPDLLVRNTSATVLSGHSARHTLPRACASPPLECSESRER